MRTFNTAGPCDPRRHYMLPAEPRVPGARYIIDLDEYFLIHAPRQVGKTTVLYSLVRAIEEEGERVAVSFSCESASVLGNDIEGVIEALTTRIIDAADSQQLPPEQLPPSPWPTGPAVTRLRKGLEAWSRSCPLPLVLFIDEIDSLSGAALESVLRQLRDGHNERIKGVPFPASVVLCGMRNIRDYKAASGGNPETLGSASPFNVIVDSLRVADFTMEDVTALYAQHTADTGQPFTPDAVTMAYDYTRGQPWLVNAIAREATLKTRMAGTPQEPITPALIDQAKEKVIRDRAPHVDSLAARLREPRVQRVIEPLLAGIDQPADAAYDDDVAYVRDLGLITDSHNNQDGDDSDDGRNIEVANPMYREIIVRILSASAQAAIRLHSRTFLLPDGRIDMGRLMTEFAAFWDEHGEIMASYEGYHETAAQLIFMAYLQRVVNGGGYADREYGAGRGWIDILVRKPHDGPDGRAPTPVQVG